MPVLPLFPIWSVADLRALCALIALTTSLAAAGADASEIAVLPVDAPGLLPGVRESLDAQLHTALEGALGGAGLVVQDAGKTQRFVKDAVDAGLSCSLTEDDCALKAAIAANADAVVVVRALTVDERLVVELRKVAVDGSATVGVAGVVDPPPGDTDALARLARRLASPLGADGKPAASLEPFDQRGTELPVTFNVEPKDVVVSVDGVVVEVRQVQKGILWLAPGPHVVQLSRRGFEARSIAVDVTSERMPPPVTVALEKAFPLMLGVGIGVGVGGAMLAVASGVGVGLVEGALAAPQTPEARESLSFSGRVLVGGAVLGVVAAGAGAAVALLGGVE